jgi:uncharacterized membrane protein
MLMNKHAQTVLTILMFGIVIATGTLLVSVWLYPPPERTATIAMLNESMQAGPYPTNITQYSNITLNIEVYNYLGVVQYFYVRTKLADSTTMANTTTPSSAPILQQNERILSHGSRWVIPIQINMTTTGLNFRLTFELWRYDINQDNIVWVRNLYGEGLWVHLPLNVTS